VSYQSLLYRLKEDIGLWDK